MDETLDKMTKLANDLCDQLEKVEAENKSLKDLHPNSNRNGKLQENMEQYDVLNPKQYK